MEAVHSGEQAAFLLTTGRSKFQGLHFVNGTFPGLLPGRPAGGDRPGVNGAGGDGG